MRTVKGGGNLHREEVLKCLVEVRRLHAYISKCLTNPCSCKEQTLFLSLAEDTAEQLKKIIEFYRAGECESED